MREANAEVPIILTVKKLPWTNSVGPHLVDAFNVYKNRNKPIYYAIGEIVEEEHDQLQHLMFTKERQNIGPSQVMEELWEVLEGYRELEARTDLAMMLEETDGDIENHPDYITTFDRPFLGDHFSGWSSATNLAKFYLFNQRILQIARIDPTGRKLLKSKEEDLEGRLRRVGKEPHTNGRLLGFRQAKRRYNQILNYLIQNEAIY